MSQRLHIPQTIRDLWELLPRISKLRLRKRYGLSSARSRVRAVEPLALAGFSPQAISEYTGLSESFVDSLVRRFDLPVTRSRVPRCDVLATFVHEFGGDLEAVSRLLRMPVGDLRVLLNLRKV